MSDLIERDKVLDQLHLNHKDVVYIDKNECAKRIMAIPSARPKGERASVLAELHERFDALEKELRRASAEMSAIIREYADRPKGKWLEAGRMTQFNQFYYFRYCSECFYARDDCDSEKDTNFCPHCGADMRGAENGTDKDKPSQ